MKKMKAMNLPNKLNNPFNIRKNKKNHWKGKIPSVGSFESFLTIKYGIRAFIVLIMNYRLKYNIVTVYDIIHRYAPEAENDTNRYINFVCRKMQVTPDTEVTRDNLYDFARYVAFFESGFLLDKDMFNDVLMNL